MSVDLGGRERQKVGTLVTIIKYGIGLIWNGCRENTDVRRRGRQKVMIGKIDLACLGLPELRPQV